MDFMEIGTVYTDGYMTYVTPDGIGRVWYESPEEAMEDTGADRVVRITTMDMADY